MKKKPANCKSSCVSCHKSNKGCDPEEERPCRRCVAGKIECIARERKKRSRKEELVDRYKIKKCRECGGTLNSDNFCVKCEEEVVEDRKKRDFTVNNEALKKEILHLRSHINMLASREFWEGSWMLLRYPDVEKSPKTPVYLPYEFLILRSGPTFSQMAGRPVVEGQKMAHFIFSHPNVVKRNAIERIKTYDYLSEEYLVLRIFSVLITKFGLFAQEKHATVLLERPYPRMVLTEVKGMWKVDEEQAKQLLCIPPAKIASRERRIRFEDDPFVVPNFVDSVFLPSKQDPSSKTFEK